MKGKAQDTYELTRIEAYLLSEKAGHPSHMNDYFWTQAEAIVRQRTAVVDVAVKAVGKKKTAKAAATTKAKLAAKPKAAAEPKLKLSAEPEPAALKAKKSATFKKASPAAKKNGAKSK